MTIAIRQQLAPYIAGNVGLAQVFVRDMLITGTIVNMLTGGLALIAYAEGVSGWVALCIFLAPFPYNVALCFFVWRAAAKSGSRWADIARAGSALWFLAVSLA